MKKLYIAINLSFFGFLGYGCYKLFQYDIEQQKRFPMNQTFVCYDGWGQEIMKFTNATVKVEDGKWIVWLAPPKFSREQRMTRIEINAVDCVVK